jgi:DNA-binding transcriptional regulator of glucitol operon
VAEKTIIQEFGIHLTDKSVSAQGQSVALDEIKEVNVTSEKRTNMLWILFMIVGPVAIGWIAWSRYKSWNENTTVQNLALIGIAGVIAWTMVDVIREKKHLSKLHVIKLKLEDREVAIWSTPKEDRAKHVARMIKEASG